LFICLFVYLFIYFHSYDYLFTNLHPISLTRIFVLTIQHTDTITESVFPPPTDQESDTFKTILQCRRLTSHFHGNEIATELLKKKQENRKNTEIEKELVYDDNRTWWSTFLMLDKLLFLKPYLAVMFLEELLPRSLNLTNKQWDIILDLCVALRPFLVIINVMATESHLTGGLVPGTYCSCTVLYDYTYAFFPYFCVFFFFFQFFLLSLTICLFTCRSPLSPPSLPLSPLLLSSPPSLPYPSFSFSASLPLPSSLTPLSLPLFLLLPQV
jgi:hypothetical protein